MSGFITIYNIDGEPVDEHLTYSLTQSLKFRGPDQQKIWVDENIGMGHALFKTTYEAEYENQPATLDGNIWITCSARIDDRKNLINKLGIPTKINLDKTPDSELILHAYRKWGEECLTHLLGDFAFVIWDHREKKLFCARDRFGMRQLYYAQKNKSIIICNSLDSILEHPNISKELNERAIGGFLLFGNYTWMDKSITMFNDVVTLLPAHKLVIKNEHINIQRYWDIPNDIPLLHYQNDQDYVEHFLEVFTHAVSDRIRTPSVAISMSGGMDSTSIAAIAKQLQDRQKIPNTQFKAITAVYDHILPCKERYYSGLVANHLNIPIHYLTVDNYPFLQSSIKTTYPMEIPQAGSFIDVQKKFSQFSRVVLIGDGADNLIEYPSTLLAWEESDIVSVITNTMRLQQLYGKIPPLGTGLKTKIKRWFSNQNSQIESSYPYPTWINDNFEKRLNLSTEWEELWSHIKYNKSLLTHKEILQKSLVDADWNTDGIFMKSDFTLPEKRDPFLDLRMLEFILSLPALPWLFNKHILRASMKGLLPDEVRSRPKTLLGPLHHVLATKAENNWLETWKPSRKTAHYIKKTFSFNTSADNTQHYLDSRPIILDTWLKENIY